MSPFAIPGIFTFFLSAILAVIVLIRRPPQQFWPSLFFVILSVNIWSLGETLAQYVDAGEQLHWIFVQFLYTGILMLGPAWWNFSLAFASHVGVKIRWDTPVVRRIPVGLAVIYWIGLVTNPIHGQFITANIIDRNEYHFIWYCQAFTAYAVSIVSLMIYVTTLRRSNSSVKTQAKIMIMGSLMPFIANVFYVFKLVPMDYDPTVSAMAVSACLYFWGVYRSRLFALSPLTLQQLIYNDEDVCLVLDRDSKVLVHNDRALDFFGRESITPYCDGVELLESRIQEVNVNGHMGRLLPNGFGGQSFERQIRLHGSNKSDGTWLQLTVTIVRNQRGKMQGIGVRIRDLTDLVEKTITIDKQTAMLEAIVETSGQGILVADENRRILFANSHFQKMWSIPDSLCTHSYDETTLALAVSQVQDPDAFLERMESLYNDRALVSSDLIRLKDGRVFDRASRPILIGEELHGRCWLFDDVTEAMRAEERKSVAEKRLRESQRLESLGVMAGGIAHDFNNLLFGISGNSEILLNRLEDDSPHLQQLNAILSASNQAADLVNQMLSYAGKGEFKVETIQLSSLVDTTASLLATAIPKSVSMTMDMDQSLSVNGDVVQLRQVVMNLITNASESYEGRAGTVSISVERVVIRSDDSIEFYGTVGLPGGAYARIEISDLGVGMNSETLRKLFDPFFTTKFDGRGLGLAAVLGIVRSHGGALSVQSVEGEGTTFSVYLPIYSVAFPEVSTNGSQSQSRKSVHVENSSLILIVDDESIVLEVLSNAIRSSGFDVLTAKDGLEALEIYAQSWKEIDVVILDLAMPRMGGEETLLGMKEINADVNVVFASGRMDAEIRARLIDSGATAVLEKPYPLSELLGLLTSPT